jgi:hypothetical protein
MSTLKDKVMNAISPADQDEQVAAAYTAADADRKVIAKVHGNVEKNSKAVADIRDLIRDEALAVELGAPDADLKKLKGRLATASEALEQSENALVAAQQKAIASERALNTARGAGDLRRIKRIVNERHKRTEAFVEATSAYVTTGLALLKANAKIGQSWPLGPAPRGALLYEDEVAEAIGYELARLAPRDSLSTEARPAGAVYTSFRNSFEEIPLLAKIEQADAHLVRLASPK